LLAAGVGPGEVLAVSTTDGIELTLSVLAAARLGLGLLFNHGCCSPDGSAAQRAKSVGVWLAPGEGLFPRVGRGCGAGGQAHAGLGYRTVAEGAGATTLWCQPEAILTTSEAVIAKLRLTEGTRLVAPGPLRGPQDVLNVLIPALLARAELSISERDPADVGGVALARPLMDEGRSARTCGPGPCVGCLTVRPPYHDATGD